MAAKTGINLLTEENKTVPGLRILKSGSFAAIGVYLIILVGMLGTSYFFSSQKAKAEEKNSGLVASLGGLKKNEELLVTVKNRVSISQAAFAKGAVSPAEQIKNVLSLTPPEVSVATVRTEENGTTVIIATSKSSKAISSFFATLAEKKFATVFLSGFSLNTEGVYSFSLSLE